MEGFGTRVISAVSTVCQCQCRGISYLMLPIYHYLPLLYLPLLPLYHNYYIYNRWRSCRNFSQLLITVSLYNFKRNLIL